jgi:hypothetical protein
MCVRDAQDADGDSEQEARIMVTRLPGKYSVRCESRRLDTTISYLPPLPVP